MKTFLRWATSEKIISKSSKGSKHRRPDHPRVEAALLEEFKELRKKEVKVKGYWFKLIARQLPAEIEPDSTFKFSDGWFNKFKTRNKIGLR
jgi:hypothetical protein